MPNPARSFFLAVAAALAAGCGGLAHPLSDDGNDAGNKNATNPGTTILTINVSRQPLYVGDTASLVGSVGGLAVSNNGLFNATSSDPSVLSVGGTQLFGRSAGTVSISASYSGYQATPPLTVTVYPSASGYSAIVSVLNTDPPVFVPASLYLKVGSLVSFGLGTTHSLTFDALVGAPASAPVGAGSVSRTFATVGSFTYHCTAHGEAGTVNVTP